LGDSTSDRSAPSSCGDGVVDTGSGEECDEGPSNDGRYGGCKPDCTLASFCGDGVVNSGSGEQCDDGDAWDVNGCTSECRFTPGLQRWYRFNERSGYVANDELGGEPALVKWGRRWNTAPGFDGGLVASDKEGQGFVHVEYSTDEVDPTDSEGTSPIQYVDLGKRWPSPDAATLSVWARRVATSNAKGLLLWMGSEGDGAGGTETIGDGWSPNHEIWMRYEGKETATTYGLSMGVAASHVIDISTPLITPKPNPVPPETKCSKSVDLEYGKWHHLVLTFRNLQNPEGAELVRPVTKYTAYVNGVQVSAREDCHSVNLNRFTAALLGRSEFKSNNTSWLGDIDDFMQFGVELTSEQVAALYEAQQDGR
jgi:cysteine-rich repeat protein